MIFSDVFSGYFTQFIDWLNSVQFNGLIVCLLLLCV